jgi:hypothetical protein
MSSDALTAVPEPARVIGGEHRGHAGYQNLGAVDRHG